MRTEVVYHIALALACAVHGALGTVLEGLVLVACEDLSQIEVKEIRPAHLYCRRSAATESSLSSGGRISKRHIQSHPCEQVAPRRWNVHCWNTSARNKSPGDGNPYKTENQM
jgi:hypothetical protein